MRLKRRDPTHSNTLKTYLKEHLKNLIPLDKNKSLNVNFKSDDKKILQSVPYVLICENDLNNHKSKKCISWSDTYVNNENADKRKPAILPIKIKMSPRFLSTKNKNKKLSKVQVKSSPKTKTQHPSPVNKSPKRTTTFTCNICDQIFRRNYLYKAHNLFHVQPNRLVINVERCQFSKKIEKTNENLQSTSSATYDNEYTNLTSIKEKPVSILIENGENEKEVPSVLKERDESQEEAFSSKIKENDEYEGEASSSALSENDECEEEASSSRVKESGECEEESSSPLKENDESKEEAHSSILKENSEIEYSTNDVNTSETNGSVDDVLSVNKENIIEYLDNSEESVETNETEKNNGTAGSDDNSDGNEKNSENEETIDNINSYLKNDMQNEDESISLKRRRDSIDIEAKSPPRKKVRFACDMTNEIPTTEEFKIEECDKIDENTSEDKTDSSNDTE